MNSSVTAINERHATATTSNHNSSIAINERHATAEYLASLPIGYRFNPTDEELMIHYLLKKIKNDVLPRNMIPDESHPKDLAANYPKANEDEWYFFSSREWQHKAGKRPRRDTGAGYWRVWGKEKVMIKDKENGNKIVGVKDTFTYFEGRSKEATKTVWLMQEYVAKGYERQRLDANDMKLDDYVLCKIYKSGRKKGTDDEHPPVEQNQSEQAEQNQSEQAVLDILVLLD